MSNNLPGPPTKPSLPLYIFELESGIFDTRLSECFEAALGGKDGATLQSFRARGFWMTAESQLIKVCSWVVSLLLRVVSGLIGSLQES